MAHRVSIFLCVVALLLAPSTFAHEVRPAYFEAIEHSDGSIDVLWKQPLQDGFGIAIAPQLSAGWLNDTPRARYQTPTHRIERWHIAKPTPPLALQQLRIDGLDKTITDVLARVRYANGIEATQLIKPEHPQWTIPAAKQTELPIAQHLTLGIEHIWTGIDHLLYVFGLILLVGNWRLLLQTITAFTLAHSITLGAAALHLIPVAPAPVEAVIALSIVYVAAELVYARRGRISIAQRSPWLIAFGFGLLHGFGFAGALAETGLPANNILLALLLFNLGIEIGQLIFVGAVLAALSLLKHYAPRLRGWVIAASPHVIGSLAACWLIERMLVAFRLIAH